MPGFMILIFVALLAVTLTAVALGAHVVEVQRRKRVGTVLETVNATAPVRQTRVLFQGGDTGPNALAMLLAKLNLTQRMEAHIQQAGMDWSATQLAAYMLGAALAGAIVGSKIHILLLTALSIPAMALLFSALPLVYVMRKRKKRLAEFEEQFPEALDFLARAMKVGHAFSASLEMLAAESPEPLKYEFKKVYNEQSLGAPLSEVLPHLAQRVPLVDVRFFISAVLMQRETGGNLGEILVKLAFVIRERFRLKGAVKSASAHGRITALVLIVLPIGTALAVSAASPMYLQRMAQDSLGRYMLIFAVVAMTAGIFIMRKIVNIKV
jgi:tight adherence protein B